MLSTAFICRVADHKRSKRAAVRDNYEWRSECVFCHIPMVRLGPKNWRVHGDQAQQHQH